MLVVYVNLSIYVVLPIPHYGICFFGIYLHRFGIKIGNFNLKLYLKFMYSVFEVCVLFGLGAKVISSGSLLLLGDEFVSCLLVWIVYAGCSVTSRLVDST